MEEEGKYRSKCQLCNHNPKEPIEKRQTEKKAKWFKLASRPTKDEISHNQN